MTLSVASLTRSNATGTSSSPSHSNFWGDEHTRTVPVNICFLRTIFQPCLLTDFAPLATNWDRFRDTPFTIRVCSCRQSTFYIENAVCAAMLNVFSDMIFVISANLRTSSTTHTVHTCIKFIIYIDVLRIGCTTLQKVHTKNQTSSHHCSGSHMLLILVLINPINNLILLFVWS